MQLFQPIFLSLTSLAVLVACSNSNPTTSSSPATTLAKSVETAKAISPPSATKSEAKHGDPQKGGQVIESGIYHLELVVAPEENGIHSEAKHGDPQKGGQVIESGIYHLELVVAPEENGIHLDFFLQKGDTHEAIPDAEVTAQVQLPDGTQKTLDLIYDAPTKHYTVTLSGKAVGEYKVVILSDIKSEKVNGRFNFKL